MGTISTDPPQITQQGEISTTSQTINSGGVSCAGASSEISSHPETNHMLATSSSLEDIPPPRPDYYAPPPYEVATQTTKLPTYEEVQREKHLEDELFGLPVIDAPNISTQFRPQGQRIVPIDNEAAEDVDTSLLGTDFMFYIAFFGLIICIRAILQYLSIKRGWHMLSASHQERLLFFY
ncbi:nedd4 family interacting protein isoform X2 [Rhynchophorus ferrugineus]|uniref:nedd4 family interacting protein isoform X2 n=1 Tax=Rhynchophorus ferrugineus TaxID=354439 RepID=UPI003FCD20A3